MVNTFSSLLYRYIVRPILFRFDSEAVHRLMVRLGVLLGDFSLTRKLMSSLFVSQYPQLIESIADISFRSPVGLAAGFDYNAELMEVLPSLGFGFQTVGTITNLSYAGNTTPRLGRLVKSRSLLVNKGFKNDGISAVLGRLSNKRFRFPVGLSIGITNTANLKTLETGIADIVSTFRKAEQSNPPFSYYELNISCPNLNTSISFYAPEDFRELLMAVTGLRLSKPLFIKMPIDRTEIEFDQLIAVVLEFPVQGIIVGNLLHDRKDSAFVPAEINSAPRGNFSGIPTQKHSDHLIARAYKASKGRLTIIGCGGVFSAEDAYRKIRLGASLIQLITGLVFVGPQLVSEINRGLVRLLDRDTYNSISEAIGVDAR
ncbi:MAG: dihydroorotate dehydrogenase (quinone) [Candidatus Taylorbacteria bacterium RIFCSPHIGHO2_01_FULL_46_22b]|uniref:Dihydroorotate dehydrogenase (quinone) n=1 Tax=Candidatus Taylorbacteria bacterium RIFCSPHIGHO2_01_FULL_46_22b TaxID=1802301 RepID=A0A1G2M3M5_9BACT|nr:MAG: dihydroorotate dehydrogenase (quinone) [Candidatus Taylorbacteria bacterium RIFCSPHIGHO2_01_FULL_46_22b]